MTRTNLLIRLSPWLFTIGLFVVWEAAVHIFKIPVFFLPPPTAIAQAFVDYAGPLARNSWITLQTTLIGFALAVGFGMLLGLLVGWSRAIYAGLVPADDRLQCDSESRAGADPGAVVRHRLHSGGADRLPDFVLSDRRQCGDRPCDHRARAGRRAQGARRFQARHHAQGGHPAHAAVFLRLAESRDHAWPSSAR